ncbi:MAG: thermonuclease family protein [Phycisphaerae bacterium]|nr:thermonuclease family protein [Phycisphaerae bacterium]
MPLVGAALLAAAVMADRAGLFGKAPPADVAKYHLKSFRVVRVIDGDTLDIDCPDGSHPHTRVRLWGVDTPETVKPESPVEHFGPQASEFTRSAPAGKEVTLELESRQTRDKYGRLLAYVFLGDGRMLNRQLVAEGYGYADPRYEHRYGDEFARLQRHAMRERLGLWAGVRREDLPYYYRDTLKLPEKMNTGH